MKAIRLLPLLAALGLAACGEKTPPTPTTAPEASAAAPAPAAAAPSAPEPAAAPAATEPAASTAAPAASAAAPASAAASASASGDLAKGEQIYSSTCLACHGGGVMGAPKFGDKAAWQPRIAKGKETLYTSALNGFKLMPPKGGNAGLKDEEVKAAVDYMVSKAS